MGKLTKQQQQTIGLIVMVVVGGGYFYWNYMLKPTMKSIRENQVKYEDLLAKIKTAENQAKRLPALQNELAKLELDLASLEKQLPKGKDLPNIIRILTREAVQEGLSFVRFGPKAPIKQQFFEVIPFDIQFTGTVHALARFLASLGQQDRIFQAQNISLVPTGSSDQQGVVNLNMTLTIQTYSYAG